MFGGPKATLSATLRTGWGQLLGKQQGKTKELLGADRGMNPGGGGREWQLSCSIMIANYGALTLA